MIGWPGAAWASARGPRTHSAGRPPARVCSTWVPRITGTRPLGSVMRWSMRIPRGVSRHERATGSHQRLRVRSSVRVCWLAGPCWRSSSGVSDIAPG